MCIGFRGICFDDFLRNVFRLPIKRNNLDLNDPIGGLSEHGGGGVVEEPPETYQDLPLSSTSTLNIVTMLKYENWYISPAMSSAMVTNCTY